MSKVIVVGSCNLDFIVEVAALPVPGQTVLGGDVQCRPGGKGANQAVAARRLGAETVLVSATGTDQFGETLRAALHSENLDLTYLAAIDGPTGVALIVVDAAATNQITVAPGANQHLTPEHLDPLGSIVVPATVLLLQLEIPLATCIAAARNARHAGASVVVNAAPLPEPIDAQFELLLEATDVLIVNETEAAALGAQADPTDNAAWQEFAKNLSLSGPPAVVVTLGGAGAVAAEKGVPFWVPAFDVDAVDSTGAGDAFCGAVAAALSERNSLEEAVRRGCAAGALATTAVGAQAALPRAEDLNRILTSQGGE